MYEHCGQNAVIIMYTDATWPTRNVRGRPENNMKNMYVCINIYHIIYVTKKKIIIINGTKKNIS